MRKALSLLVLTMLSGPAFAADSVPIESVKALAALDNNGGWRPIFDNTLTALMRRYFSSTFNQAWAEAMKHNKDSPVFDADPLTGEQNGGGIKSVSANMEAPNRVAAKMMLHDGSERSVEFLMIHSAAGEWFINDIIYPLTRNLCAWSLTRQVADAPLRRRGSRVSEIDRSPSSLRVSENAAASRLGDARQRRAPRPQGRPPSAAQSQRATRSASCGRGGCIERRSSGLRGHERVA
jgi:hypothetical protein